MQTQTFVKYPAQQSSKPHADWFLWQLHRTLQNKSRICGCTWDLRNKLSRFLNMCLVKQNPAQTSVMFQSVHSGQQKGAGLLVTFLGWRGVNKIYNYTSHFYSISQCMYIVIKNTLTKTKLLYLFFPSNLCFWYREGIVERLGKSNDPQVDFAYQLSAE